LSALVAALAARCYRDGITSATADGWLVEEIARGHNGIVFRARSGEHDLAAKVSQVDDRGRAAQHRRQAVGTPLADPLRGQPAQLPSRRRWRDDRGLGELGLATRASMWPAS
jgi:hypothetical protein